MEKNPNSFVRHAAIYLVARGLPGIIMFLAIPVFTRLLDPEDYGKYALVVATVNLLNAMLFQWLRLSLVRYLPAFKEDPERLKSTLLTVQSLLIGAIGVIAVTTCVIPAAHAWRPVIVSCWVILTVQAPFELFCEHARAQIKPWRYMGLHVTRAGISLAMGAAFIVVGFGWWGPLAGTAIGLLVPAAYAYRREWSDVRFVIDRDALLGICKYGIPLSLTVALAVVISSSDRFLIAWLLGDGAAGLYSVAVDFTSQTLTLLMTVVSLAMFPLAVRAWEESGREAAQERMRDNASFLLALGLPATVGLIVLAPSIADCFLGKSYRGAAVSIIPLIALGAFLAGFKAYHFDAAFQFAHKTIYQVWIVLTAAIVNLGLNLIAIPALGINGAAVASVIAYVVSISLTVWLGRRHIALPFPVRPFMQVLAATGMMALALYPLRPYHGGCAVAGQIASGAVVYGTVLIALNFLEIRAPLARKLLTIGRGARRPTAVATELEFAAAIAPTLGDQ